MPHETVKDQNQTIFDLCVIGCGSGGFASAMHAFDAGKQVCIVEGDQIGGAGVKWGALASKTLWELSKDFSIAAAVDRGYRATGLSVDFESVRQTAIEAVKEKQYQMLSQMETFSPERWKGPGTITYIRGRAQLVSDRWVEITGIDDQKILLQANHILICTGSHPRNLPGITVDQQRILNSDGVLNLKTFPKRLMIIGAGIIGCEYATIFSNYRQTRVFLIDNRERILPFEDVDISDFVSKNLAAAGVKIIHSARLRHISKHRDHMEIILDFEDGHSEMVEVDTILISVGRSPNIDLLRLERVGIQPGKWGYLKIDNHCRVKDSIYAAGDVTNHPALVNIAEMEGRHAVDHMFGRSGRPLSYDNMSTIMFFRPEVAAVGYNELTCRKKRIPYRVASYSNYLLPRAIAMRALNGFVKIIVSDDGNEKILGMRAAGPQVSSTITSITHLMDQNKNIHDVLKSVYPHPTISEGIQECFRMLIGESLYKPRAFPDYLTIRRWHPEKDSLS